MKDPAISCAGDVVCFAYQEDLWLVSSAGGQASRLTVASGRDWHPEFSPRGDFIAFNSDREGWTGIYLIPATGGKAVQVTREDFELLAWFPDGKNLLVKRDEFGYPDSFYKVDLDGNFSLLTSFGGNNASITEDGCNIIFDRGGLVYREAYQGSYNGDLWRYDIRKDEFSRLTLTAYTEQYPLVSRQQNLYYAASDGKNFQLYRVENLDCNNPVQLTDFREWSVRKPDLAKDNHTIVFELFDEIWIYDPAAGKTRKLKIDIRQDTIPDHCIREDVDNKIADYTLSPDGKLIVFSYKFDLFAIPEKGGDVKQLTADQKGIKNIQIMPDNRTIYFSSYVEGNPELFRVRIDNIDKIEKIKWSEGKYIEFLQQQANQLLVNYSDAEKRNRLILADSLFQDLIDISGERYVFNTAAISPDSSYILFIETRQEVWSRHIILYDITTEIHHTLLDFDGYLDNVGWGKDRKSLFYTANEKIYRMDLQAKKDFYTEEDNWGEILGSRSVKAGEGAREDSSKIAIDYDDIASRTELVVNKPGWNGIIHVVSDSVFYYLNKFDEQYSLRQCDYFGRNDVFLYNLGKIEPQNLIYSEANRSFYYVVDNTLKKFTPQGGSTTIIRNKFKYKYDEFQLNCDIFKQVWIEFGRNFYDPGMHGIDWQESLKKYATYLEYVHHSSDLKDIVYEMIGEVNASHTGFYPRKDNRYKTYEQAYCGFILDFTGDEKDGFLIKKVFRDSKLNKPHNIREGDILISVDGNLVGKGLELNPLFRDKVGEKIRLGIMSGDTLKIITIKGLSHRENSMLFYKNWVAEREDMVTQFSGDRIGYLHIRSMNNNSYEEFLQDLFARNFAKEALIIDIRNNGGGYIHDKLIEVLTKRPYAYITRREFDAGLYETPYKIWSKPLVLLINEFSFSDAEIFPSIFHSLKLGKIIGMPTSGSVIGTGHHNFMDGSSMRMPRNGWFREDGTNMEGSGVIPDILVEPTPRQYIQDEDIQLKIAVEELLHLLDQNNR
ncbi:MAG: PD40 domain-containing protein [Candidatus Cloacimonetes bacterium]|nr:PD40 domain-containing protein [Candidatus Cloacimonadota bacterium]